MFHRFTALAAGAMLAILLTLAGPISHVYACSCMELRPGQALELADVAFEGVVTGAAGAIPAGAGAFDEVRYSFAVQTMLKGRGVDTIEVATAGNGAACGIEFSAGQLWRVYVSGEGPGAWSTGLCSGNELLSEDEPIPAPREAPPGPPPIGALVALGASALVAVVSIWAFTRRERAPTD